ncbi:glycine receptor subunit alpha-4-like isoform X1 [Lampetra planeri]
MLLLMLLMMLPHISQGLWYSCDYSVKLRNEEYDLRKRNMSKELHNYVCNSPDYDKMIRPNPTGDATDVKITIAVKNFGSIDVLNMEYKVTVILVQWWIDHRLRMNCSTGSDTYMDMSDATLGCLWRPSVFFDNKKSSVVHSVTAPNSMLRIYDDGNVFYTLRITLTLSCHMDLHKYPWIKQTCPMTIVSASYTDKDVLLQWHKTQNMTLPGELNVSQFDVDTSVTLSNNTSNEIMGNISRLHAEFKLCRSICSSEKHIFISSGLISILSCFSFLIPTEKAPARVAISVATTISMTMQCASTHANMPKVPYMTSIDNWMVKCLLFIISIFIISILQICYYSKDNSAQNKATALQPPETQNKQRKPAATSYHDVSGERDPLLGSNRHRPRQGVSSQSGSAATLDSGVNSEVATSPDQPHGAPVGCCLHRCCCKPIKDKSLEKYVNVIFFFISMCAFCGLFASFCENCLPMLLDILKPYP